MSDPVASMSDIIVSIIVDGGVRIWQKIGGTDIFAGVNVFCGGWTVIFTWLISQF